MTNSPFRVLMELRPCLEGFAGIPQETRLLFAALRDIDSIETHGLINHPIRVLTPGLRVGARFSDRRVHRKYGIMSRFIISQRMTPYRTFFDRVSDFLFQRYCRVVLTVQSQLGMPLCLYDFDGEAFPDFIWNAIFAKSVPTSELRKVVAAPFRTLRAPWHTMHRVGIKSLLGTGYPSMRTVGYNAFISQTPFPAKFPRSTQLVVRYHDAIPIFLPQYIPDTSFHQMSHYLALRANAEHGVFVCTSEATRSDLLRMFPRLERRSPVIHDIVSHNYFVESGHPVLLAEIIKSRLNDRTQPKFLTNREKVTFYERHLQPETLRYIVMVSTLEPRKNHVRLIRAWEQVQTLRHPDLKLVIVGELGWDNDRITQSMRPWQERGRLFHLTNVPASDLRLLYGSAACVMCPSIAEGFDLSGIEAMLSGGAVAASDIAVHREVYGDSAVYFHPYSIPSMANTIESIIAPERVHFRADLREHGLQHAQKYKREAIRPQWGAFFERVRAGDFARQCAGRRTRVTEDWIAGAGEAWEIRKPTAINLVRDEIDNPT